MANQLTKDNVKMGYVLPVENMDRKPMENERYLAVYVEDQDGENERWILLSDKELESKISFSIQGVTEDWKLGRLFSVKVGKSEKSALNLHFCEEISSEKGWSVKPGSEQVLLFSKSSLTSAEKRASKNAEDLPKMGWLEDLKN